MGSGVMTRSNRLCHYPRPHDTLDCTYLIFSTFYKLHPGGAYRNL